MPSYNKKREKIAKIISDLLLPSAWVSVWNQDKQL